MDPTKGYGKYSPFSELSESEIIRYEDFTMSDDYVRGRVNVSPMTSIRYGGICSEVPMPGLGCRCIIGSAPTGSNGDTYQRVYRQQIIAEYDNIFHFGKHNLLCEVRFDYRVQKHTGSTYRGVEIDEGVNAMIYHVRYSRCRKDHISPDSFLRSSKYVRGEDVISDTPAESYRPL